MVTRGEKEGQKGEKRKSCLTKKQKREKEAGRRERGAQGRITERNLGNKEGKKKGGKIGRKV